MSKFINKIGNFFAGVRSFIAKYAKLLWSKIVETIKANVYELKLEPRNYLFKLACLISILIGFYYLCAFSFYAVDIGKNKVSHIGVLLFTIIILGLVSVFEITRINDKFKRHFIIVILLNIGIALISYHIFTGLLKDAASIRGVESELKRYDAVMKCARHIIIYFILSLVNIVVLVLPFAFKNKHAE